MFRFEDASTRGRALPSFPKPWRQAEAELFSSSWIWKGGIPASPKVEHLGRRPILPCFLLCGPGMSLTPRPTSVSASRWQSLQYVWSNSMNMKCSPTVLTVEGLVTDVASFYNVSLRVHSVGTRTQWFDPAHHFSTSLPQSPTSLWCFCVGGGEAKLGSSFKLYYFRFTCGSGAAHPRGRLSLQDQSIYPESILDISEERWSICTAWLQA